MLGNAAATARVLLTAEDRTGAAFASVQKNLTGVGTAARNVGGLVSGIGATAALIAITSLVRNTTNYADEMSKLAQRAGVTTEAISALAFAARLADVDNDQLAKGLREIGNDAAEGGKKLTALGISLTDASGKAKTSDALLMDVADTIAGIEEPAKRAAVAAKLFGDRVGPELIPLLAGGAAGLREAAAEAANFGKVVTTEAGRSAELFNDNMTRLTEASSGLAQQLAGPMISSLANTSSYFLAVAKDVGFARAALISFGGAVARTLGVDNVGQLQSQARANSNAIALTVKQIETFQKLADRGVSGAAERVAKLREQYTALQRTGTGVTAALAQEANSLSAPAPASSRRDVPDVSRLLGGGSGGRPAGGPGKASSGAAGSGATTYDEQITQRVGRLFEESDVIKAKEYADTLARLDDLYFKGLVGPELYDSAVKKLTGSTAKAGEASTDLADQQRRLAELLSGTASAALEGQRSDMLLLAAAFEKGTITARQFEEASAVRLGLTGPESSKAVESFSQALHEDVKGALSNAFRDTKDPIRAFGDALANVVFTRVSGGLATSIADGLLGKGGAGGGILSGLGSLFSFDGGGYTGSGPRSGGMDGRGGFMAMVHPNETVVDHSKGQRAGGNVVNILIPTSIGDISSKADVVAGMQTVRAQILGELQRSARYGGALA
jgi:hypothetical protein